jgi:hypothetical protein
MASVKIIRPMKKDEKGLILGNLSVSESTRNCEITDKETGSLDIKPVPCFVLEIESEDVKGNKKKLNALIFGMNIKPEATIKRIGTKNVKLYNKFTTALLRLGVISKEEIEKAETEDVLDEEKILNDFLAISNMPIKYKLIKNKRGYDEPDLSSLELIEPS